MKPKVSLVKDSVVDVNLFIFSIKNVCSEGVSKGIAKEILFKFKFKWC